MTIGSRRSMAAMISIMVVVCGCSSQSPKTPAKAEGAPAAAPVQVGAKPGPTDIYTALSSVALKVQPGEKVCIVCNQGKKARDARATRAAEDALRRIATQRDKGVVIDNTAPPLASLLDAHLAKPEAELPEKDLLDAARKAGAAKLVLFQVTSGAAKADTGAPFLPATSTEEPMAVEVLVMDTSSGKVLAAGEASTVQTAAAPPGRAYPLRVVGPEYLSHPDVPDKPKPDSNLLGRRWRALSRVSDALGPQGVYDNPEYQEWTRINDQIGPFPFYTGEPTLIMITSTPPNARVFVNGQDTALTPCWLPLEEGDKVSLVRAGFITEEFRVPEKTGTLHVDLRPR